MRKVFKRFAVVLAMVAAVVVAVPQSAYASYPMDDPSAGNDVTCFHDATASDSCVFVTYGHNGSGAYGISGNGSVTTNWSGGLDVAIFRTVTGRVCVTDSWANGRGVKVNINLHRAGRPFTSGTANWYSAITVKDPSCQNYSATLATGFDGYDINYADSWSSCSYCFVGDYHIRFYWGLAAG